MNRREVIKTLFLAGGSSAALLAAVRTIPGRAAPANYYVLTARPDADLRRLADVAGFDVRQTVISSANLRGVGQDLTIRTMGGLVDPLERHSLGLLHGGSLSARSSVSKDIVPALADYAAELRSRKERAHVLLSIETGSGYGEDVLTIEQDGIVREVVPAGKNYDRIEVPGPLGRTILRLKDGRLTVREASCRHGLCQKLGHQHRIICAPNRLIATLPRPRRDVDFIAG